MSQDALLEWRLEEEPPQQREEPPARHEFPSWLRWLLFWVTVVGLAISGILYARYQHAERVLQRDIQAELDRERQALRTGDMPILRSLLDPRAPTQWHGWREVEWKFLLGRDLPLQVREVYLLRPNVALAEVWGWPLVETAQVRLYRRTAGRWMWSAPRQADWGPFLDPAEFPCARIHAWQRDRATLQALAEDSERLCAAIARLMGASKARPRPDIFLNPEQGQPEAHLRDARLLLPSPWLLTLSRGRQVDALIRLINRMADARAGVDATLGMKRAILGGNEKKPSGRLGEEEIVKGITIPEAGMRIAYFRYRHGQVLVHFIGEEGTVGEGREWWQIYQQEGGRWHATPGNILIWGPKLYRRGECASITYRWTAREWVLEAWPLVQRMCERARQLFGTPLLAGTMDVLISPNPEQASSVQADVVVPDPVTWPAPVYRPLHLRLARRIAQSAIPYFLYVNSERRPPPFIEGLALAYFAPEVAWMTEERVSLRSDRLAAYTDPEAWASLEYTLPAISLGMYVREQWGEERLGEWLFLLYSGAMDTDILAQSAQLALGVSFTSLLQGWYLDVDPTMAARETWIERMRVALSDIIRFLGPASRVYVYAGGRPSLPGTARPGTPWRGLEGLVQDVPVNVRSATLSPSDVKARPDALHVQFFLPQSEDTELEVLVMRWQEEGQVETLRLGYRFQQENGRWIPVRQR